MVHLLPLPGSYGFDGDFSRVEKKACEDAMALKDGGIDAIIVENACDNPFLVGDDVDFATISAMSVLSRQVRELTGLPVGISCATNAVRADLAIARAAGAEFIRSTGWVNGYFSCGGFAQPAAAKSLRYRESIKGSDIAIMADVQVKNGSHFFLSDKTLPEQCNDAKSAHADYVILTGNTSGVAPDFEEIKRIKQSVEIPLIIGSGATLDNITEFLDDSDGVIIGSYFKDHGRMSDPILEEKVCGFMDIVRKYRSSRK